MNDIVFLFFLLNRPQVILAVPRITVDPGPVKVPSVFVVLL